MPKDFHRILEKADPLEHPAARAARMIKQLHQDTIDAIDKGAVFMKDGVDRNFKVRDACLKQIDLCDEIIKRAPGMDVVDTHTSEALLADLKGVLESNKPMRVTPEEKPVSTTAEMPEIGNYDHKKTE